MIGKILNSRYQIIRQLGQGGFGATFIAEDRWQNQKHCVIKQLKPDVLSPETKYLFEKEAEILFKLGNHNQIPQLLAHFQEDGVFYIVQEFIEGNDLNQEIKRGEKLGEKQVIKLLIEILEVLEYVHHNQVIHRDIKPANIIRYRDGKIVLIDFGGIKQVRARSADSTVLTAIVGTLGYMPMEQFNNNAQFCSDIYAVGMMGIFALTGIVPGSFSSSPEGEILWRDKAQISEQLADIFDKMVKFDYRQRYQSATEVLAVLKWFLLPKHWRCVSTLEGYSIFTNEGIAISPDKQILASSGGKKIKLWQLSTGKEIRTLSSHSKLIYCISISRDGKLLVSGSLDKTIKLWEMNTGKEIYTLSGDSLVISSVAFSPDSQILIGGSFDNTIKLWQVSTGREIRNLTGHSSGVYSVTISPDGQLIASASADNTIKLWQVNTGREISTFNGHSETVRTVAFSPDGQTLAGGSYDSTIRLWEVSTGREISTFNGHSATVRAVAFSPDGQILASASYDGTIKIWQVSTGREVCTLTGHSSKVNSIVFSPDGQLLASGSGDKTIKIWQRLLNSQISNR